MAKSKFGFLTSPPGRKWEPQYPSVAIPLPGGIVAANSNEDAPTSVDWVSAPPASHVHSFAFLDPRVFKRLRTEAQIYVRFKPPKNNPGGPLTGYRYVFSYDEAPEAERIFRLLKEADHPGYVVNDHLKGKVKYRPL